MVTYGCNKCGMSVNTTCRKCDEKLLNDTFEISNGSVQLSKCQMDMEKLNHLYDLDKI